jgi:hypothetical protein
MMCSLEAKGQNIDFVLHVDIIEEIEVKLLLETLIPI